MKQQNDFSIFLKDLEFKIDLLKVELGENLSLKIQINKIEDFMQDIVIEAVSIARLKDFHIKSQDL